MSEPSLGTTTSSTASAQPWGPAGGGVQGWPGKGGGLGSGDRRRGGGGRAGHLPQAFVFEGQQAGDVSVFKRAVRLTPNRDDVATGFLQGVGATISLA